MHPAFLFITMTADQVTRTGANGTANHGTLSFLATNNGAGARTNSAADHCTFFPAAPFVLCRRFIYGSGNQGHTQDQGNGKKDLFHRHLF